MILVITHKEDFTADFVIDRLNRKGTAYIRLNCEDILKNRTSIHLGKQGGETFINDHTEFASVWFRRIKYPDLPEIASDVKAYCYQELDAYFHNLWLSVKSKKWMSIPHHVYFAENKAHQLRLAQGVGFRIPETIITGDALEIKQFFDSYNGNVIIKPLGQNRLTHNGAYRHIFTNRLTAESLKDIAQRLPLPSVFQECIEKEMEYRITVVGDRVFVASVDSQADPETRTDWRRKKNTFKQASIPAEVEKRCIALTKELGISFGAIDLVKTIQGDYIFLEINPNGQWAWLETDTGMPISESIADFLTDL